MAVPESDQPLVAAARRGDTNAFDLLVIRYQHRVMALLRRFTGDLATAEDLTQETFLRAWRGLSSFRGSSGFYTWLYRIAINAARNHHAAMQRRPQLQAPPSAADDEADDWEDMLPAPNADPEQNLMVEDLAQLVHKSVEQLPEVLRIALLLRERDGFSYEEIAEVMQCPVGTVRSRIFRARQAIDESIRPEMQPS